MLRSEARAFEGFVCPGFFPEGGRQPNDSDPFISVPVGFDASPDVTAMSVLRPMAGVMCWRGPAGRMPVEELSM